MKLKVYLINLEKDVDRLNHMTKQLDQLGIEFERIDAINGREIAEINSPLWQKFNKTRSDKENGLGRPLTYGEVGCSLSHLVCYEKLINSDLDCAIILEDDLLLDKNFWRAVESITSKGQRQHWNIIQFTYTNHNSLDKLILEFHYIFKLELRKLKRDWRPINLMRIVVSPVFNFFLAANTFINIKLTNGLRKNLFRNQPGAGCYMLDKRAAARLLEINNQVIYTADVAIVKHLYKMGDIFCLSYYPPMAFQNIDGFPSSIDSMQHR